MYSLTIPRIAVPADGHRDPVRQLKTVRRPPIYPNGAQAISPAAPSPPFRCPHAVHRWIRAKVDHAYAQMIASLPWVADDITEDERRAIVALASIVELDQTVARTVAGLPWAADDITETERRAIEWLFWNTTDNTAYAQTIADLPWVVDGITYIEQRAIESLYWASRKDRALAQTIISLPWVVDDIAETELQALDSLNAATPDTARQLLEMARPAEELVDDSSQWDIQLLAALGGLGQATFEDLSDVPWFTDGVDDEEEALLVVLRTMRGVSPDMYIDLVLTRHTQSATVSLPLAGEVNLWAFQPTAFPPGENLVEMVEDAVRATEGFIGAPFPTTQVILLVPIIGPETDHGIGGGLYWGKFITVTRYEPWPINRGAIYHEVAHYYFPGGLGPTWLVEGGAEFMWSYTNDQVGIQSLEDRKLTAWDLVGANCLNQGMRNIRQVNERTRESDSLVLCNYSLGAFFLLNLFETLGEEATGAAIRELHLLSTSERRPVTEEEIYRAFLKQTPAERIGEFRQLYRLWHGGSFVDEE